MIKRIIVLSMIFILVLTFCSCGKKAKTNDKSSGDKSDESSVILSEDTIDGSVDIDIDDIPELIEDDTDSNATDNTSSSSGSDDSSKGSTSSKTTSEDKKSDNKSSSSSESNDATEKNDDAVDKDSMNGWDPLK